MAKMTVLEMVQNILSATDGDEVNSIYDTIEATQVAVVLKETYMEMVSNIDDPSKGEIVLLDGLSDPSLPTYLSLPSDVDSILWWKYDYKVNDATTYTDVQYLDPLEFVNLMLARAGQDDTLEVTDPSGARFWVFTNVNPHYWTSFDNRTIIADSFDSDLDSSLQQSKTIAWGYRDSPWTMDDSFVPDLESNLFPRLLAEAKSTCMFNQHQTVDPKEEQKSRRQLVRNQNNRWKLNQRKPYESTPDYGRRKPRG